MTYYKYDGYGSYITHYTLDALETITADSTSSSWSMASSLDNTDDRYEDDDYKLNGVVKLCSDSGPCGSGFVIDQHIIVTAAHCVADSTLYKNSAYKQSCGAHVTKILCFDSGELDWEIPQDHILSIHIPQYFFGSINYEYNDYALIYVEDNLSPYLGFDLGTVLDTCTADVYSAGFPYTRIHADGTEETINTLDPHTLLVGEGVVVVPDENSMQTTSDEYYRVKNTAYLSGGNSGGPLYLVTDVKGTKFYTVIGICAYQGGSYNWATRITPTLLHFYLNNPYLS